MKNLIEKESVKKVEKFLKKINSNYEIIILEKTARTAQDAAESLNVKVGSIVKSLVFKSENNQYLLCLISGDRVVSLDKLSISNNIKIIKAEADEVKSITGYSIGGVPPFAHKNVIKTFIDISLSRFEYIYAAAGHPHCVFKITYKELCKISLGNVINIS